MSSDSGGSGSQSANIDVPSSVQETATEHDFTNSQLAVSQGTLKSADSLFPALYNSVSASLQSSKLSGSFSVASLHARYDPEHKNEDATQYPGKSSSEGSSQDTLEEQDARSTPQSLSPVECDELSVPQQAEETENTSQMVFTDYYTSSLTSLYNVIDKKPNLSTTSTTEGGATDVYSQSQLQPTDFVTSQPLGDHKSESMDDTALFTMDNDDESAHPEDKHDSSTSFTTRLSLNFAKPESAALPNPTACAAVETPETDTHNQPNVKDEVHTPATLPNSADYIDRADEHRDPTQVAASGENSTEIKREKVCMSISNCASQVDYTIPKFNAGDAKVECTLHSQGLDQDYIDHKVTVTSIIQLPKHARNADSLYAEPSCTFKLSAYISERPFEEKKLIGKASEVRKLSDNERESLLMHMTVHNVASQEDIIFSKRCPEKIFVRVTLKIIH